MHAEPRLVARDGSGPWRRRHNGAMWCVSAAGTPHAVRPRSVYLRVHGAPGSPRTDLATTANVRGVAEQLAAS